MRQLVYLNFPCQAKWEDLVLCLQTTLLSHLNHLFSHLNHAFLLFKSSYLTRNIYHDIYHGI